jgi:Uma2 family endonuclease
MVFMAPPATRPAKTVQDYLALPDDVRAELIAGELYVTPAPRPNHQRVVQRALRALAPFLECEGLGEILVAPVDVHLPSGGIVQPDLVFVGSEQASIVGEEAVHGAPHLLIEVVSYAHSERDRIVKYHLYEKNGVAEYWIVDPEERSLEVFVLVGRRFEPRGWFTGDDAVISPSLPGLALPVQRLFP